MDKQESWLQEDTDSGVISQHQAGAAWTIEYFVMNADAKVDFHVIAEAIALDDAANYLCELLRSSLIDSSGRCLLHHALNKKKRIGLIERGWMGGWMGG